MAVGAGYLDYVLDQLACLEPVTAKRMIGGAGLYLGGTVFALVADDTLCLRVDDGNRAALEAAGMGPLRPYRDRPTAMPYCQVPAEVLEDTAQRGRWCGHAVEAALRRHGCRRQ